MLSTPNLVINLGIPAGSGGEGNTIYVDSVAGNDNNDGTTEFTPVQTIAAGLLLISDGYTIKFKRGSVFTEKIDISGISSVTIDCYGDENLPRPLFDGSQPVPGGTTWTLDGGAVWTANFALSGFSNKNVIRMWEGDREYKSVNSTDVNTTPGSIWFDTLGGVPTGDVYIYAFDGGNPNTDGKSRRITLNNQVVKIDTAYATVKNIVARRNSHDDGSIVLPGTLVNIENCEANEGTKHNVLIGQGTCDGLRCYGASKIEGRPDSTLFVAYTTANASSQESYLKNCVFEMPSWIPQQTASPLSYNFIGVYAHDAVSSGGGGGYKAIRMKNCTFRNLRSCCDGDIKFTYFHNCKVVDCISLARAGQQTVAGSEIRFIDSTMTNSSRLFHESANYDDKAVTIESSAEYVYLTNSQFVLKAGNDGAFRSQSAHSSNMKYVVDNCLFAWAYNRAGFAFKWFLLRNGETLTSRSCVYYDPNSGSDVIFAGFPSDSTATWTIAGSYNRYSRTSLNDIGMYYNTATKRLYNGVSGAAWPTEDKNPTFTVLKAADRLPGEDKESPLVWPTKILPIDVSNPSLYASLDLDF